MTDDTLSADQLAALAGVLDEIIPPSADGRLPGAGAAGVAAYVVAALGRLPDLRTLVVEGLADLERAARERHGASFTSLSQPARQALVAEQGFVFPLTLQAYVGYYQTPAVVAALGLETRPPHPEGFAMPQSDLASLLEPVRRRGPLFRDC
jgi:hypothetical protein